MRPELFGRKRSPEWAHGKLRSGRSGSVAARLERMGIELDDAGWARLARRLEEVVTSRRVVREEEREALIRSILSEGGPADA